MPRRVTHQPGHARKHPAIADHNVQRQNQQAYKRQRRRRWATNSAAWRRIRKAQLAREPLCRHCKQQGKTVQATDVDHIDEDPGNNHQSNLQSLCGSCHATKTHQAEAIAAHAGGNHHGLPIGAPKPACPVTVLCGPPGAGKSHHIATLGRDITVIDMVQIKAMLSGRPLYEGGTDYVEAAIAVRNRMVYELAEAEPDATAIVETLAPQRFIRQQWREILGAEIIIVTADPETCLRRIQADRHRRARSMRFWRGLVFWWFSNYVPDENDVLLTSRRGG